MPTPRHDKVVFSGTFGPAQAPVEIWSWSLSFGYIPQLRGTTAEIATVAREAYALHVAPYMPTTTILTRARVARLAAGGKVTTLGDGAYDQGDDLEPVPGLIGASARPLQVATVVSFDTARSGPTGKGRCFLPGIGIGLQEDFRWSANDVGQVCGSMRALITALEQNDSGDAPRVSGLGQHGVASSKGVFSPTTLVRVGRVPDTMRSRREGLLESYVEQPLSHVAPPVAA
jgi:hypothetical protein